MEAILGVVWPKQDTTTVLIAALVSVRAVGPSWAYGGWWRPSQADALLVDAEPYNGVRNH